MAMETACVSSTMPLDSVYGKDGNLKPLVSHENSEVEKLISDRDLRWLEMIFFGVITMAISFFGIIANIINIVIFLKQGLNDTVNINLLGLAVSDLGSVLTLAWMCICMNPLFRYSDIPFDSLQMQHITAGIPKDCFTRITCWITIYVTLERCLCIGFPLRVKDIITVRRTTLVILFIFLINFIVTSPVAFFIRIDLKFIVARNETLISLAYLDDGQFLETVVYSISAFVQLSSFPLVIVCTIVLIRNLLSKSQWRKMASGISASGRNETAATLRDKRVIKMVSFIACIFIACFLPSCVNIILIILLSPDYNVGGQYEDVFAMSWAIINCFGAGNSFVNIFVYYNMSSKFRAAFNKLFGIHGQRIQNR